MAGYALGGILTGLMKGYDDQNAQNQLDRYYQDYFDQRAFQRRRDVAADARGQTEFNDKQADRAHMLERRPIEEGQKDADYGLGAAIKQLQLQKGQHDFDRLPALDAQDDAKFALDQQAKRQSIAESGQRMSLDAIKMQLDRLGLDQKRVDQARQQAQDALEQGFAAGRMTGDWGHLADAYNATIATTHGGAPISAITQGPDGSFTVSSGSGSMKFADQTHLFQAIGAIVDPKLYMQDLYAGLTRKDQPAAIQETNAIFQRLPAREGEDENARWMRAYAMRSAKAGESPEAAAAGFYKMVSGTGANSERALAATRQFMSTFYPGARGAWNGGAQQPSVQPAFADPGNGVAPPPRFAQAVPPRAVVPRSAPALQAPPSRGMQSVNHGRPIATAIDRDGRYGPRGGRVVRYEDGTVAPAN
jgi:hypothetical protein